LAEAPGHAATVRGGSQVAAAYSIGGRARERRERGARYLHWMNRPTPRAMTPGLAPAVVSLNETTNTSRSRAAWRRARPEAFRSGRDHAWRRFATEKAFEACRYGSRQPGCGLITRSLRRGPTRIVGILKGGPADTPPSTRTPALQSASRNTSPNGSSGLPARSRARSSTFFSASVGT